MPGSTTRYGFNTFMENDYVDWDLINQNFNNLDGKIMCIASQKYPAFYYLDGSDQSITASNQWQYKEYADKTFELSISVPHSNLACGVGAASPYASSSVAIVFPDSMKNRVQEVSCVQVSLKSEVTVGYVINQTPTNVLDRVVYKAYSNALESNPATAVKSVDILVKGVLNN